MSAADCAFLDMVGLNTNMIIDAGAVFVGSEFTNNKIVMDGITGNSALITGASKKLDTLVWMESCTLTNNSAEKMLVADQRDSVRNVTFVSDTSRNVWILEGPSETSHGRVTLGTTKPLSDTPQTVQHLTANDPWLRNLQVSAFNLQVGSAG